MAKENSTVTLNPVLHDPGRQDHGRGRYGKEHETYNRYLRRIAREAERISRELRGVWIEPYAPYLNAQSSWLPTLESRIRASVVPDEYEGEESTEWLNEDAANAAITFFRAGADLLPTEPHIYATRSGDLVAEFETSAGNMTTVISDHGTILFAVLASDPENPIQDIVCRGSNHFRDQLRSFTKKLFAESHGPVESAE